jgi:hypothetical protein
MSVITPDIRPMHYVGARTVNWSVDPDAFGVAVTVNDLAPAISEYIAYDTLNPPNPFLAVTQDGNGNVVYDGGFPKFYNSRGPDALDTQFSQLNASFKFLYNAINFCANPIKVAEGNRKVLLVGDQLSGNPYSVKDTAASSFRTSFTRLCNIANFELTIKDRSDWGGAINFNFTELDQYCCVIVMGSDFTENPNHITNQAVQDIVTYRSLGNGIILITDHGPNLLNITQAQQSHSGFFTICNRIAVNFGAYFTGDVNRSPVNVGFLRSTYGNHPLYNGMADSEDIFAGGSESIVVVTETPVFAPETLPASPMIDPGRYTFNFLVVYDDRSLATVSFTYTIIEGEFVFLKDASGDVRTNYQLSTFRDMADFTLENTDASMGTLVGDVLRNDRKVGEFVHSQSGTVFQWFSGGDASFPMEEGDRIGLEVRQPFGYYVETTVVKQQVIPFPTKNLAAMMASLNQGDLSGLSPEAAFDHLAQYSHRIYFPDQTRQVRKYAQDAQHIVHALTNPQALPPVERYIYATTQALTADLPTVPSGAMVVIDAQTGNVYTRQDSTWAIDNGLQAQDFLGAPRVIIHPISRVTFTLHENGTFTHQD